MTELEVLNELRDILTQVNLNVAIIQDLFMGIVTLVIVLIILMILYMFWNTWIH